jgi:hypothetical protein
MIPIHSPAAFSPVPLPDSCSLVVNEAFIEPNCLGECFGINGMPFAADRVRRLVVALSRRRRRVFKVAGVLEKCGRLDQGDRR